MPCIQQVVYFSLLLFNICYVNCNSSERDLEACSTLKIMLNSAKREVAKDDAFRDYLINKNIFILPDEPAVKFFSNVPLRDDLIKIYQDSSIVFEVSESYAESIFQNNPPRSRNINPLLRKNSCCLEEHFKTFCVDSKNYKCEKKQKYRSIDGYCMNLDYPKEGAAATPFVSFLDQSYDDSMSKLRKQNRSSNQLPLARKLSSIFFDRCQNKDIFLDDGPSISGAQFGVFLTQDIVSIAYPRSSPSLTCCKKDYSTILPKKLLHKICDPIKIPKDDIFFGPKGIECMNFMRIQNSYDNECVLSSRKQLNLVTSSVDLSQIYGSAKEVADSVRTFANGLLKTNADNLLPEDLNGKFILSDFRACASPIVLIFNVLFIREHNRIACYLKIKFPNWNDELIFQEARRWNIAQYQYIVFKWMQMFIPQQYKHLLISKQKNAKVPCATSNEFGNAIFRLHHKFISEVIELFDKNGNTVQEIDLGDADPSVFIRNFFAKLARSLFYQKQNYNGCHNQIRNQLFKNAAGIGMDVISFDIKRGRDHGVQPYYKYVQLCLNKKVKSFSDLKFIISKENIKLLRENYQSVFDIDLYIGAQLEKRPKEFQFGPVGSCITNEQFYRYRFGDSFFFDNPQQHHPFTEDQLAEIRKASFSRILCNNGDIKKVSKDAFFAQNNKNKVVDCELVPVVNIVY